MCNLLRPFFFKIYSTRHSLLLLFQVSGQKQATRLRSKSSPLGLDASRFSAASPAPGEKSGGEASVRSPTPSSLQTATLSGSSKPESGIVSRVGSYNFRPNSMFSPDDTQHALVMSDNINSLAEDDTVENAAVSVLSALAIQ